MATRPPVRTTTARDRASGWLHAIDSSEMASGLAVTGGDERVEGYRGWRGRTGR
jgi:hypothetical protein